MKRIGAADWDTQYLHGDDYELVVEEAQLPASVESGELPELLSPKQTILLMFGIKELVDSLGDDLPSSEHDKFIATMKFLIEDFDNHVKGKPVNDKFNEYIKGAAIEVMLDKLMGSLQVA